MTTLQILTAILPHLLGMTGAILILFGAYLTGVRQ
jgi:hypothetical protein